MQPDYYRTGLDILRQQDSYDYVFVFSDDPEWCKENLDLPGNVEVVSHKLSGPNFSHYLNLMSACSGFVIPNSSFGWWGAWLSQVPGSSVVAPSKWFANPEIDTSDIVPKSWIRI
jgi:hypothetical protein